jgi:hypothetical protein
MLGLALLVASCTPPVDPAPGPTSTAEAVLESRAALGTPMVQLAEAVIALADGLATARYELARGPEVLAQLDAVQQQVDEVRATAGAAGEAADGAPVHAAAEIVRDAAQTAGAAADDAEAEVAYLQSVGRLDRQLLAAAALWDEPGSQSQIRTRLDAAARDVSQLRRRARGLQPFPADCRVMRRNRVTWASTVRARTERLQAQANSAGGGEFDQLRTAFRRLPLGEEPRSADQQERRCWRESSGVWGAANDLRAAVEALEAALN